MLEGFEETWSHLCDILEILYSRNVVTCIQSCKALPKCSSFVWNCLDTWSRICSRFLASSILRSIFFLIDYFNDVEINGTWGTTVFDEQKVVIKSSCTESSFNFKQKPWPQEEGPEMEAMNSAIHNKIIKYTDWQYRSSDFRNVFWNWVQQRAVKNGIFWQWMTCLLNIQWSKSKGSNEQNVLLGSSVTRALLLSDDIVMGENCRKGLEG